MIRTLLAAALLWPVMAGGASAAELKILTAGAFKPVLQDLAHLAHHTGDTWKVENDTAGGLMKRVEGGEAFDLIIVTDTGIAALQGKGKVAAGATANLARVGIGVAVRTGAPAPDLTNVDTFRQALLAAPSVAYIDPAAGGSSGIYLAGLFNRLGIADAILKKAVLVPGGLVADRVARGEAALGMQQISELLVVPGVTMVGPLPAEVQNYTVYSGGVGSATAQPDAARRLLMLLTGPEARDALHKRGMEPPT